MLALLTVLFLSGVILLLVEILLIPGFGLAGLTGTAAVVASLVLAASASPAMLAGFLVALGATGLLIYLALRHFGYAKLKDLILSQRLGSAEGYVAGGNLSQLQGETGKALTPLRPAGTAEIAGTRVAVVSQGEFIPAGASVVVVHVEGQRVVVTRQSPQSN